MDRIQPSKARRNKRHHIQRHLDRQRLTEHHIGSQMRKGCPSLSVNPCLCKRSRRPEKTRLLRHLRECQTQQAHRLGVVLDTRATEQFAKQKGFGKFHRIIGHFLADAAAAPNVTGKLRQIDMPCKALHQIAPGDRRRRSSGQHRQLAFFVVSHIVEPHGPKLCHLALEFCNTGRVGSLPLLHPVPKKGPGQTSLRILLQFGGKARDTLTTVGKSQCPPPTGGQTGHLFWRHYVFNQPTKRIAQQEGGAEMQTHQSGGTGTVTTVSISRIIKQLHPAATDAIWYRIVIDAPVIGEPYSIPGRQPGKTAIRFAPLPLFRLCIKRVVVPFVRLGRLQSGLCPPMVNTLQEDLPTV
ncbi:hypothetical protein [Paracoccus sp. J56]|uniref:hypothetical protein n=1 Tax=Paracoccus sp. J56 TaxID=935850 RepID=UPI001F0B58B8|nr:hypothetical protein [Paracoccus sp. J56]